MIRRTLKQQCLAIIMKINNKVLAFVYSDGKFLALHSNPDKEHGEGGWFVVTGGLENNESLENAVKREIKEETGLEICLLSHTPRG